MTVSQSEANAGALPIQPAMREQLSRFVARTGERNAARALELNRQTLARAVAGFALQRGTIALLEQRLRAVETGGV